MTEIVIPQCSRWVVHELAADGTCSRCGWHWRLLLNGVEQEAGEGSHAGPFVVGLRDNDNGPCVMLDPALLPAGAAQFCNRGDEPWPPGIDMILERSEWVEDGPHVRFKAPDRVAEYRLVP